MMITQMRMIPKSFMLNKQKNIYIIGNNGKCKCAPLPETNTIRVWSTVANLSYPRLWIPVGGQHYGPAVLPSVKPSSNNGREQWMVLERLWTFWEKIKCWHTLGFKPRMVHSLAQSLHPLRHAGSIQHWLQACWNAKLITKQQIQKTVTSACWLLDLCKLEISCHAACIWTPTICRLSWPCDVSYYLQVRQSVHKHGANCTDWPKLQRTEFLTIRTAVMFVLPHAVSRSATPLSSSEITCRPLDKVQAFPYSSHRIADWRCSEILGSINTF
jgi:hypothetical protein